jgi:hypothetical protein
MSARIGAGLKYFIYARQPSVFMSHKVMSLTTTFDSMFYILTNLAGLGKDKEHHHPQMNRWVHRGLRLHEDWWRVWEESINRFAKRMSAPFDWPTPRHGGYVAKEWRLIRSARVSNMTEERAMGADIKAAAAMMHVMNMQPADKFLIPEGPQGNKRGRFTTYLKALLGPTAYSVATWSERDMWIEQAAQIPLIPEAEEFGSMEPPPEFPEEEEPPVDVPEDTGDGDDDDDQAPPRRPPRGPIPGFSKGSQCAQA